MCVSSGWGLDVAMMIRFGCHYLIINKNQDIGDVQSKHKAGIYFFMNTFFRNSKKPNAEDFMCELCGSNVYKSSLPNFAYSYNLRTVTTHSKINKSTVTRTQLQRS